MKKYEVKIMNKKQQKTDEYDHEEIEAKWQKVWEKERIYEADLGPLRSASQSFAGRREKTPYYNLMMFPYPSAGGLHVGNMYAFTGSDIYGRFKRMQGNDVFEPIGLDGFGIHSENYALKINEHPMELSKKTQNNFYRQLHMIGNGFAWEEKLETYNPEYYKFTQWIFTELFKAGLAYRAMAKVNWCPSCKTVLADEQAVKKSKVKSQKSKVETPNSKLETQKTELEVSVCERCSTEVEKRELAQWFFRITNYAQRLLDNIQKLDWSEKVKVAQRMWIGKSEGVEIMFSFDIQTTQTVRVFTTRADTIFGVTFLVLAPEHPLVTEIIAQSKGQLEQQIRKYIENSLKKTDEERIRADLKSQKAVKTGVFTGLYAKHPLTGEKIPVYVADYVLMSYGTGAVMGVPAHDARDWEFARKYGSEVRRVVGKDEGTSNRESFSQGAFTEYGVLENSGEFDGMQSKEAIEKIAVHLEKNGLGKKAVTWHLRDWIISRQRYWGVPIPMIFCKHCSRNRKSWFTEDNSKVQIPVSNFSTGLKPHVVNQTPNEEKFIAYDLAISTSQWDSAGWYPEDRLPVELPYIKNFKPTGTGISPLAQDENFVKVDCPGCGQEARRETDVSDTFLDSAWYFLRYPSQSQKSKVKSEKLPWDEAITKKWLPVDMYIGGAEHAVLHLLYSRFITMVFSDLGLVDFEEPFSKFRAHGLLIEDGAKMSKSKGNVVNPDDYIAKFGADVLRCYLMFCGRYEVGGDFRDNGIEGMQRFLKRVWKIANLKFKMMHPQGLKSENLKLSEDSERMMHITIKRVTEDIESLSYNTAIAALMEWLNFLETKVSKITGPVSGVSVDELKNYLLLLAPFAPHVTEELFQKFFGNSKLETRNSKQIQNPKSKIQNSAFRSIHLEVWPDFDEAKIKTEKVLLIVQVDGKLRDKIEVDRGLSKDEAEKIAKESAKVTKFTEGKKTQTIYVPDKLVNLVTST